MVSMQRLIWVIATVAVAAIPSLGLGQATPTGAEPRDTLRAGDIIRLKIWREPDLTGDFTVAENGEAQLPKIGAVPATMLSSDSLTRYIRKSYETYLRQDEDR